MRTLALVSNFVLLLGLVAALPAESQDWRGKGRVEGVVTDADGAPVEDATVTLVLNGSGPQPLKTNKRGRWSYLGLVGGSWTVMVAKDGYQPTETTVPLQQYGESARQAVNQTLLREEQALAETDEGLAVLELRARLEEAKQKLDAKEFAAARALIEEALPLLDEASKAPWLVVVARTHYDEKEPDKAVETAKRALTHAPEDVEALRFIASLLTDLGRTEEAKPYLERLPEGEKIDPDALLNQGIAAYNGGELEQALEVFDQVVADYPDLADAYYYRGLVNLNQAKNAEALADFEKLLELQPDHPNAGEAKQFVDYLKTQ